MCDAQIHTVGTDMDFVLRQSNGELTDPGTYNVTVRVCTNETLLPAAPTTAARICRARSSNDGTREQAGRTVRYKYA